MNKTKIEWCNYTFNPVTGCLHNCHFCYAKNIAHRFTPKNKLGDDCTQPENKKLHEIRYKSQSYKYGFKPTLHSYRLNEPLKLKKSSKIFVCSMADLFGDWIPNEWIYKVISIAEKCFQHTFQFLTKNPKRYYGIQMPDNCWRGVTITKGITKIFPLIDNGIRFASFEPLLGNIKMRDCPFDWIIIGAMTGQKSLKYQPKVKWIENILKQADKNKIPVFMKNNLVTVWKGKLRQEFPNEKLDRK